MSLPKKRPPKRELEHAYRQLTIPQLKARYRVSIFTLYAWLQQYRIPRKRKRRPRPTPAALKRALPKYPTKTALAAHYGVDPVTISRWLEDADLDEQWHALAVTRGISRSADTRKIALYLAHLNDIYPMPHGVAAAIARRLGVTREGFRRQMLRAKTHAGHVMKTLNLE